jgi:acetolactate synthase-1/3 small subunit
MSSHVLSLLVEDKPGLLTRVAGLFARRGFNIESLAVGHSEIEGLSRITVVVDNSTRSQVLEAVNLFRARVVDVATDALVIEVTGDSGKTTAFLKVLEPYGIKEIAQSGLLAIGRGSKSITERVFKN